MLYFKTKWFKEKNAGKRVQCSELGVGNRRCAGQSEHTAAVLDAQGAEHESGCYRVPSPARSVLLRRAETLVGEAGAPPRGYRAVGTLKSQRGTKSLCLLSPVPPPPTSSGFCGHKEVPRALQVSPSGQCHSTGWSQSRRCGARPRRGTAPTTGTARKEASLGKIVAASANCLPE